MNRRGFFRILASAPAAAVVAPVAIAEAADIGFVSRQAGKSGIMAYLYGMNKYGARNFAGSYSGRWECPGDAYAIWQRRYGSEMTPLWQPCPEVQSLSRLHRPNRKPQFVKTLELDFAEIERKMMQYYKDDKDFTLKALPGRNFRAIMDEVYEVEDKDEPEHIEGLA